MRESETSVKPFIRIQRNVDSRRECLPMRDMADCLLQAYDCVARSAYRKFLLRGGVPGGELDDWLNAEHELLGNLAVDVEDAGGYVSALASVPGLTSEDVDVGIDPRWLVILGRHSTVGRAELDDQRLDEEQIAEWASSIHADARTLRFHATRTTGSHMQRKDEANAAGGNSAAAQALKNSEFEALDQESKPNSPSVQAAGGNTERAGGSQPTARFDRKAEISQGTDSDSEEPVAPSQLFCILELPTEVDPSSCVAVLANGLLGIRMPKKMK
ncbi:MAG: DUF2934 domain-containing protein [Candidatus Acidiferrales bacterium]